MDTKKILSEWSQQSAYTIKPKLADACDVIESLCVEVVRLKKEVEYQKGAQSRRESTYKNMVLEVQNVVGRYI